LIVDNRKNGYSDLLKLRGILWLEDCAEDHSSEIGYSSIYGARPPAKIMREHILKRLANIILLGDVTTGGAVTIRFDVESRSLVLESSTTGSL
jgi:ATP-dependent Clp protease ATP-binding subunit ClpA